MNPRRHPLLRCILALALLAGCGRPPDPVEARDRTPGPPHRGLQILVSKHLSAPVMTVDELERFWTVWEPDLQERARIASKQERRRMTFERYGFIHREFDDTGLPLGYTDDGRGNLAPNCLSCHGGKVAGRSYPGLANTHQDLTTLVKDRAALQAKDRGRDPDRARAFAGFGIPLNFVRGLTNATQFSVVLAAMRDEDLNLVEFRLSVPLVHNDMDAPPWWHYKRKDRIFCDAMAPKTTRTLMQFAMSPTVTGEQIRSWEPDFDLVKAFIESLEPPPYPFAVDRGRAREGRKIFNRSCSGCHGTYGEKGEYPGKVVALEKVGTDPIRLGAVSRTSKESYNRSWFSNYGKHPAELEPKGYIAPPLDGIWATAPYLHNGSIPTLYHLFHPDERPRVWERDENGYDRKRIGLAVEEFNAVPAGLSPRERRRFYDASLRSHGNRGHLFPDRLTEEEKIRVLEYLKTL